MKIDATISFLVAVSFLIAVACPGRAKELQATAYANKLVGSNSTYLQQHAHNPVNWYPWGSEAFQKAKEQNKPIFLSIGYASCHWCHVMENESFSNQGIAKTLNDNFINIKVDREQRPDVDFFYQSAASRLTGNGGWPL